MKIKLNGRRGGFALVSKRDYDDISNRKWSQNIGGYAVGTFKNKTTKMHSLIMKPTPGEVVDHINGNKLDNRRTNLRITTVQKNTQNKRVAVSKQTSTYRGVFYHKKQKKYNAHMLIDGKRINIGAYDTEIEAATARDWYVVNNDLDHIQLNFPDNDYANMELTLSIRNKTSNYIGVTYSKQKEKYIASCKINGKATYLMSSKSAVDCAKAYDKCIVDNDIPHKTLNFPDDYPTYTRYSQIKTLSEYFDETTVRLLIGDETLYCLIDKDDYDKIKNYKWYIVDTSYIRASINNKSMLLHRFLMDAKKNIIIDHIDSDKLNNKRNNLLLSDNSRNGKNKKKMDGCTSKYLGVHFWKAKNKWRAQIFHNGKRIYIGINASEKRMARKRDLYVLTFFVGEGYKLNFEWNKKSIAQWKKKLNIKW
jgi:hypothetical protein